METSKLDVNAKEYQLRHTTVELAEIKIKVISNEESNKD